MQKQWRVEFYLEQTSEGDSETWRIVSELRGINNPLAICWSKEDAEIVAGVLNIASMQAKK